VKLKSVIIILLMLLPAVVFAEREQGSSYEELFSLANLALADGRHDEAIEKYLGIVEKGIVNPDVYYNIGNACLKKGRAGLAILYYEKSLKLSGNNEDLDYNLALARESLSMPQVKVDVRSPLERLASAFTFKGCADMTIFLYVLLFASLIAMRVVEDGDVRKKVKIFSRVVIAMTLISASFTGYRLFLQESRDFAIVTAEVADLYEIPLEQGEPGNQISEGVKVKLTGQNGNWMKVSAPDGAVGWVKSEVVGII
jgi:tetratricopeptide (TPR) repeat protein